jgi:hypothetical protein
LKIGLKVTKTNKTLQIKKQETGSELEDWLQAGKKLPLKIGLKVTKKKNKTQHIYSRSRRPGQSWWFGCKQAKKLPLKIGLKITKKTTRHYKY